MNAGEFALTLLHSVTNARLHHWSIIDKNGPAHEALGAYCDGMPDKVDGLMESLMGDPDDFIPVFPIDYYGPARDGREEMEEILEYVKDARKELPQESDIQNQIDEIVTLIKKTRYLLRTPDVK